MNIKVERKVFIDAIGIGGSMSSKGKTLPILEMSKVTIKGNKCIISSFDGEVAITYRCDIIESDGDFVFCVNTRDLGAILKTINDDFVCLDVDATSCVVVHERGRIGISVMDGSDFPTPSKDEDSVGVCVDCGVLSNWLSNSKNFIDKDDLRPVMSGVYLYVDGNEMGCAATNAHKLYWDFANIENTNDKPLDGVLTIKAIDSILGMINGNDVVNILFSANNICFKTSNAMVLCRKIEGSYPKFKAIIPNDSNSVCDVNVRDLKNAISRANLTSGMTKLLKFKIDGLNMHLESCDLDFSKSSSEDIACSLSGDGMTIAFNGLYFLDCLSTIKGENISIEMKEPSRPVVFRENNSTILLMPLRIS